MRRLLWIVPVLLAFVVGGIGLFRARPPAALGAPAPPFRLPRLDDPQRDLTLTSLRGHPAVLNFWASWCEPCQHEAPVLARAARSHPGVAFLGVQILDGRDEGLRFVRRYGIGYPSLRDARGLVAKSYGVTGVPETVFLDAQGRDVGKYVGALDAPTLEALLSQLVSLKPGSVLHITGSGETRPVP